MLLEDELEEPLLEELLLLEDELEELELLEELLLLLLEDELEELELLEELLLEELELDEEEDVTTVLQPQPEASMPKIVFPGTERSRRHRTFPVTITPSDRASHGRGPLSRVYILVSTGSNP